MMNLSYSDIFAASFGSLTQPALEALQTTIVESIHDDQLLQYINGT